MIETVFGKYFFAFPLSLAVGLLFLGLFHCAWAMQPLMLQGGEGDCLHAEGGAAKPQKLELMCLQAQIDQAVDESSSYDLLDLYGQLKKTDFSPHRWKEEWESYTQRTVRKNAVLWNSENPDVYRTNLCGILFLEAAMNEPHMQLLKNVLLPLKDASDERWDGVFNECVEKFRVVAGLHHYVRRTGGLYGLIGASGFKNPIASFIFLGAFKSLWEESLNGNERILSDRNQVWFQTSLEHVSGHLKSQKEVLRLFLSNADPRYVDIDEGILKVAGEDPDLEEQRQRSIFDEKKQLGLPYYAILYGRCIVDHLGGKDFEERDLAEAFQKVLSCCEEALAGGDPRGGSLYAFGVKNWSKLLPEHLRESSRAKRIASIKLGNLEAITLWQNDRGKWKTRKKRQWAEDLLHTYAINYQTMRHFFDLAQEE